MGNRTCRSGEVDLREREAGADRKTLTFPSTETRGGSTSIASVAAAGAGWGPPPSAVAMWGGWLSLSSLMGKRDAASALLLLAWPRGGGGGGHWWGGPCRCRPLYTGHHRRRLFYSGLRAARWVPKASSSFPGFALLERARENAFPFGNGTRRPR
jgi:hypothetical protein